MRSFVRILWPLVYFIDLALVAYNIQNIAVWDYSWPEKLKNQLHNFLCVDEIYNSRELCGNFIACILRREDEGGRGGAGPAWDAADAEISIAARQRSWSDSAADDDVYDNNAAFAAYISNSADDGDCLYGLGRYQVAMKSDWYLRRSSAAPRTPLSTGSRPASYGRPPQRRRWINQTDGRVDDL